MNGEGATKNYYFQILTENFAENVVKEYKKISFRNFLQVLRSG